MFIIKNKIMGDQLLNIRYLISFILSDVDIFLLRENDQLTDVDKTYTTDEIRNQLIQTGCKMLKCMKENGVDVEAPIQISLPIIKFSTNEVR
jgi:hypothetical protein